MLEDLRLSGDIDNKDGASCVIRSVEDQVNDLMCYLQRFGSAAPRQAFYVAARYTEFTGWLYQDVGDLNAAMYWSNTALDLARQAEDGQLASYIWMRKSNIASDARLPVLAAIYAESGEHETASLRPKVQGALLRQKAHAFALSGDRSVAERALERAFVCAGRDDANEDNFAGYCTEEFVEMEAAHCWIELEHYDEALPTLERAVEDWDLDFSRDLSLGLARLATLHAGVGDTESAGLSVRRSLGIVAESGSRRAIQQLQRSISLLPPCDESDQLRREVVAATRIGVTP